MLFPDAPLVVGVRAAFGADVRTDPAGWSLTDLTERLEWANGITGKEGRSEGAAEGEPSELSLTLRNDDGWLTPEDPRSPYWPYVAEGTPLEVDVNAGHGTTYLIQGYLTSATPRWPARNKRACFVDLVVHGVTQRLGRGQSPLKSPLYRAVTAAGPVAYWALDDGQQATHAASGLVDGVPLTAPTADPPTWGQVSDPAILGAPAAYPQIVTGHAYTGYAAGLIAGLTNSEWSMQAWTYITPDEGAADTAEVTLARWRTAGGNLVEWGLRASQLVDGTQRVTVAPFLATGAAAILLTGETTATGWHHIRLRAVQRTALICDLELWLDGTLAFAIALGGASERSIGAPVQLLVGGGDIPPNGTTILDPDQVAAASVAHVAFFADADAADTYEAGLGWVGETPTQRIVRLLGEETIPVEALAGDTDLADTFSRTVVNGWGSADTGEVWLATGVGGAVVLNDFQVAAGVGTHSMPVASGYRFTYLSAVLAGDLDVAVQVQVTTPAGGTLEPTVMLRGMGLTTYYMCRANIAVGNAVTAEIRRLVANSETLLASATVTGLTHAAATPLKIRARTVGRTIKMRVWQGDAEPKHWHATATDTAQAAIVGTGFVGLRSGVGVGNTNPKPVIFSYDQYTATDLADRMGPQPSAKLLDLLRECERTDLGRLNDYAYGYRWVPRTRLYNQATALTVDAAADVRELDDPFQPLKDTQRTRNEWKVSRRGGSSAVWRDTADQRRGVYDDSAEVNTETDAALVLHAQARVALGTVEGLRYPGISVDLGSSPTLVPTWQALRIGQRLQVVGLDELQHPRGTVDQLVEGTSQTFRNRRSWRVTARTAPAAPYTVAVLDSTTPGQDLHADAADGDVVLAQQYPAAATSLQVTVTGPLISTSAGDYPVDVEIAGARIRVTAVSGASSPQTMTVQRGIDGWDKTLPAGSSVRLWRPARIAL